MNRTRAKELAPIIQAFANGLAIEWYNSDPRKQRWEAATTPTWSDGILYRIKPQPKLVPFTLEDNKLFRDKWIKSNKNALPGVFRVISYNESNIHIEFGAIGYASLLDEFIFEDGSPCGKYITE